VNETQIRQLYTGEYLTTARNIVFVGADSMHAGR
jgi:hypothetical protein